MADRKQILVVDDEDRIRRLIRMYLEREDFVVEEAENGKEALDLALENDYDVILLDIMMPEMDGWTLCEAIRKKSDVPIIMLTARDQQDDIVRGLKLGADDYITKPFHEAELVARMEALLRRQKPVGNVRFKGLIWNEETFELNYEGKVIKLTPKEFHMIGYFLRHPERVFSREHLIELVWGIDSHLDSRTVDSHVRNMRDKIRRAGFPVEDHLMTVWGIGYKWIH